MKKPNLFEELSRMKQLAGLISEDDSYSFENEIDITILKDLTSQYPELIKYYRTPLGDKFIINQNKTLVDKNTFILPKFTFEYVYKNSKPSWVCTKSDLTPGGRGRDKTILNTNDINEVYRLMVKCVKYLLKKAI